MEIQAIIDGIFDAGQQEIASIKNRSKSQVKAIRDQAEAEANEQKIRILKDGRIRMNRSKAVILQRAAMQALQMHANARQSLIVMVLNSSEEVIKQIRTQPNYLAILQKLIKDAILAIIPSLIRDQKIILHLDERDVEIVEAMEIPEKNRVEMKFDLNCSGGCEAHSEDGLVRVLNTFESRFERALPKIQQDLSVFFEEKTLSS